MVPKVSVLERVDCAPPSYSLAYSYKPDISLRWTARAGPEGVRLRELTVCGNVGLTHYKLQLLLKK